MLDLLVRGADFFGDGMSVVLLPLDILIPLVDSVDIARGGLGELLFSLFLGGHVVTCMHEAIDASDGLSFARLQGRLNIRVPGRLLDADLHPLGHESRGLARIFALRFEAAGTILAFSRGLLRFLFLGVTVIQPWILLR